MFVVAVAVVVVVVVVVVVALVVVAPVVVVVVVVGVCFLGGRRERPSAPLALLTFLLGNVLVGKYPIRTTKYTLKTVLKMSSVWV